MTLSFSTKWPKQMGGLAGQPNYFIDKIWAGLTYTESEYIHKPLMEISQVVHNNDHVKKFGGQWDISENEPIPKLHTIRTGNRWKAGMKIHPVINNRTKNRFQFAPILECKSVQDIEIVYWNKCSDFPNIIIDKHYEYHAYEKDGYSFIEQLALNDGFPSVEAFFQYFNEDFKGQLIHWTELKY